MSDTEAAPSTASRRAARTEGRYVPALDGIRALAVLGVMGYHGGISWLGGGFLGVDAFFVLSGFLITTLLLEEWGQRARIALGAFWARRARRLLPALFLVLLFVAFFANVVVARSTYPELRLDALSSLFYVANWHFVLVGANYFNQTGLPSPLTHTWSLAIEEQFYVLWPLIVLGVLTLTRRLGVLLGLCLAGAAASGIEMALLFRAGTSLTRLYYGTDTHAQGLLVGCALAVALAMRRPNSDALATTTLTSAARRTLGFLGLAGVGASAYLWSSLGASSTLLFEGGFLLVALATAAVLLCSVLEPSALVSKVLAMAPLRYLGRISYGLYLWHYPLFIWIDGARTGLQGAGLFALRGAVTFIVAVVSFHLVEQPIRRGTLLRDWRGWVATPVAALATVIVLVSATGVPAAAQSAPPARALKGPVVRVLILGDSVGLTLGLGLSVKASHYGLVEDDQGILGCGITTGTEVQVSGVTYPVAIQCNGSRTTEQWPQIWLDDITKFHPNVVLIEAGRWEVANRLFEGHWTNITNPAFAASVERDLEEAVSVASSHGAKVAVMNAPCFSSGEQPNGTPWPEDSPTRLAIYNRLVKGVADKTSANTTFINLDALSCPGGKFESSLGGVNLRQPDGVHYTIPGGEYLASKIWPTVAAIGRSQLAQHH